AGGLVLGIDLQSNSTCSAGAGGVVKELHERSAEALAPHGGIEGHAETGHRVAGVPAPQHPVAEDLAVTDEDVVGIAPSVRDDLARGLAGERVGMEESFVTRF